jgi:hypothetical protein
MWLHNTHIAEYKAANRKNHKPKREKTMHINPEDGNLSVCRNNGKPTPFYAAHLRKPKFIHSDTAFEGASVALLHKVRTTAMMVPLNAGESTKNGRYISGGMLFMPFSQKLVSWCP